MSVSEGSNFLCEACMRRETERLEKMVARTATSSPVGSKSLDVLEQAEEYAAEQGLSIHSLRVAEAQGEMLRFTLRSALLGLVHREAVGPDAVAEVIGCVLRVTPVYAREHGAYYNCLVMDTVDEIMRERACFAVLDRPQMEGTSGMLRVLVALRVMLAGLFAYDPVGPMAGRSCSTWKASATLAATLSYKGLGGGSGGGGGFVSRGGGEALFLLRYKMCAWLLPTRPRLPLAYEDLWMRSTTWCAGWAVL